MYTPRVGEELTELRSLPSLPLMDADDDINSAPLTQHERDKAIAMHEKFINERLKVDMDQVLQERDKVFDELTA